MTLYLGNTPIAGGGSADQTYDATSTNAQSGVAVAQAIADTITTSDLATCHVVVEAYHSGVNWYRIYDDKWCEQGQMFQTIANGTNITFLKPFASNSYSLSTTNVGAGVSGYGGFQITNRTSTGFTVTDANYGSNDKTACWEAKGYIA